MQRRLLATLILAGSAVLFAGCAAQLQTQNTPPAGDKTADSTVAVPPASSRNIVLRMTGSKVATTASDWPRVLTEWREAMQGASQEANATFVDETVSRGTKRGAGTVVDVYVEDFHFVAPGARFTLGVMTGNSFIQAHVVFRDSQSGRIFGERDYNTSSSAWQGIFAPTTDKQSRAIAADIVKQVNPR